MTFPNVIKRPEEVGQISDALSWVASHRDSLKENLAESGAILFRGFPVGSADDFDAFTAAFGYGDFTYEDSLSNAVRINLTPRVFTANEAPPDVEIFLHHEMAQTPVYPQKIFFYCQSAAERGGATPICRSDHLFADFSAQQPDQASQFKELGLRYTTHMPANNDVDSGQGRSWYSTLSVTSQSEAEARLSALGYSWRWLTDGSLVATSAALPAVRELPDGSESFFNQVIAAWCGWKPTDDRGDPVIQFGNGNHIPEATMRDLVELSDKHTVPVEWQEGDVALVDNYRVMHGRHPYSGTKKRQVLVCLAME